jgi:methanogenic corrinoid protein MtbC1
MEAALQKVFEVVLTGNRTGVEEAVRRAMDERFPPGRILDEALIVAMAEVGARFERQEF